ncbi:hypothetical protein OC835_003606 [Tilletia horrida]|nr:hypothetical protein OC835_003606 [Tilletia horrida]
MLPEPAVETKPNAFPLHEDVRTHTFDRSARLAEKFVALFSRMPAHTDAFQRVVEYKDGLLQQKQHHTAYGDEPGHAQTRQSIDLLSHGLHHTLRNQWDLGATVQRLKRRCEEEEDRRLCSEHRQDVLEADVRKLVLQHEAERLRRVRTEVRYDALHMWLEALELLCKARVRNSCTWPYHQRSPSEEGSGDRAAASASTSTSASMDGATPAIDSRLLIAITATKYVAAAATAASAGLSLPGTAAAAAAAAAAAVTGAGYAFGAIRTGEWAVSVHATAQQAWAQVSPDVKRRFRVLARTNPFNSGF